MTENSSATEGASTTDATVDTAGASTDARVDTAGTSTTNGTVDGSTTATTATTETAETAGTLGTLGKTERPLLANRRYLFLMSAQAVSNLGDWLYILALFVMIGFRWHGSPIMVSVMMLCLTGPMVLLGPFTGMLADRLNRTAIMMTSNVIMAVLVGVIPWLPQKWMVFSILVLVGVFESLFAPAESGKLKEIVPDSQMQQAASVNSSIQQLAKIVGPGISGFLVAAFGSMSAFWIDSISFILSTLLLILTGFRAAVMRAPYEAEVEPGATAKLESDATAKLKSDGTAKSSEEGGWQRFKAGLAYIGRVRILWTGTLMLTLVLLMIQLTDAQIVTLIRLIPNASSGLLGMIMGLSGAGGLVAALLVGVVKWKSAIRMMAIGTTGAGIGLAASALIVFHESRAGAITPFWMVIIVILSVSLGMCAGFGFIPFQAAAQKATPVELTGRVFGVVGSLTTAAALLGPAIGGVLVTIIGVVNAYLVTGSGLLLIGIAALIFRRWLEGNKVGVTAEAVEVMSEPAAE